MKSIFLALLVIIMISVVSVASFGSPVRITAVSSQVKYGALTYMFFETSSGPASSVPSTNTGTAPSGTSGAYSLASSSTAYLWSPQFANAATMSAGKWVLDFWGSSNVVVYLPITITNSQSSATPNPFQESITWNPSSYTTYEASDLGNIRFYADSAFSQPLFAWLESCTPSLSNTATSATAWVKLTSPIAASGGRLIIYMTFLSTSTDFDDIYWGDSPNLSTTYGQYDNGGNVFSFYNNFTGTTLSSKWTVLKSSSGVSISVNNGLTVATTSTSGYGFVISQNQPFPEVAETYASSGNSILGVSKSQSLNGFIAPYAGYSMDWYAGHDDVEYEGGSSVQLANLVQASFPAGIWQVTWSATGSEYFQDGKGLSYSGTNSGTTIGNYGIYLGQSNGVVASSQFRWARMRASPPSNVMPSFLLGGLTTPTDVVGVSMYVTDSSGNTISTIASNVQSPAIGTSKSQIAMTVAGGQVNVPQNGYVAISIFANSAPTTIYWGNGQQTNFQVPYRVLSGA